MGVFDALEGLVEALSPDHVAHAEQEYVTGDGGDVFCKCSCGVRLTFLAAQIAAIKQPEPEAPKTKAGR